MPTTIPSEPAALWRRILGDPQLRDLPFKIETNARGQIILSPHSNKHSRVQLQIAERIKDHLPEGTRAVEFAVLTPDGVKVPDVVWMSSGRQAEAPEDAAASPVTPELVIEVISPGNTAEEMAEKRELYFRSGAEEVWTCSLEGELSFYGPEGRRKRSKLAPGMPVRL